MDRSSIGLHMQQRGSRRTALKSAEDFFGDVLKDLRKERGVTQEDLAFRSGYHPTYIGQLERGKKSPSLRAIMSLAGALNMSGSELLRRVERLLQKNAEYPNRLLRPGVPGTKRADRS